MWLTVRGCRAAASQPGARSGSTDGSPHQYVVLCRLWLCPTSQRPSPCATLQGALQHGFVPGMLPYHPAPQGFYSPQVLYYPAGMAPYQQAPMGTGAGAQQWAAVRGPGMPGMPPRQQNGGGYPHPMQGPYFYAAGPGAMPVGPPTPSSGSQQRQMPMTGTGSSASASSTGWGGVPLSQSAAEMVASGLVPSPRSSPRKHVADSREVGNAAGEAAGVAASSGASSSAVPTVPRQQGHPALTQAGAAGPAEPEGAASKLESASQADPSSSGSDDMGEERQQGAGRRSSGEGSGSGGARSSPGGSSGSRRSRGNRERQVRGGRGLPHARLVFELTRTTLAAHSLVNAVLLGLLPTTMCRSAPSTSRQAPAPTATGRLVRKLRTLCQGRVLVGPRRQRRSGQHAAHCCSRVHVSQPGASRARGPRLAASTPRRRQRVVPVHPAPPPPAHLSSLQLQVCAPL